MRTGATTRSSSRTASGSAAVCMSDNREILRKLVPIFGFKARSHICHQLLQACRQVCAPVRGLSHHHLWQCTVVDDVATEGGEGMGWGGWVSGRGKGDG